MYHILKINSKLYYLDKYKAPSGLVQNQRIFKRLDPYRSTPIWTPFTLKGDNSSIPPKIHALIESVDGLLTSFSEKKEYENYLRRNKIELPKLFPYQEKWRISEFNTFYPWDDLLFLDHNDEHWSIWYPPDSQQPWNDPQSVEKLIDDDTAEEYAHFFRMGEAYRLSQGPTKETDRLKPFGIPFSTSFFHYFWSTYDVTIAKAWLMPSQKALIQKILV